VLIPEIFQSPTVIGTGLSFILASIVFVYTLANWRQRKMMYFAFLAFAIFINVLGYFLEVTATTLEAAVVACKVSYIGIPLTGIFLYCFARDFSGKKRHRPLVATLFYLPAPIFTLAVFAYPWFPFFYQDLAFSTTGLVNHLVVTPGPLYYPCIFYGVIFSVLGFGYLLHSFFAHRRYEGVVIFLIAITFPLAIQLYVMIYGLIDGWNPQRSALTISVALLAVYLVRYKRAEWLSVGREIVVQNMDDAFILLDNKGIVIDHNISAELFFPELKHTNKNFKLKDLWDFPRENYKTHKTYQYAITRDGEEMHLKVTTSPLKAYGKSTGTLVIISDDTISYKMIQDLTRLARIDDLTGLRNRATFFIEATLSFDLAKRHEEQMGCALMMDIDFFKNINDTYGHAIGDEVLAYIGNLIRSRFRHTDIYGRYGGEELCVWMPATVAHSAKYVAEEIRAAVESKQFFCGDASFRVTISIGIACMKEGSPDDFEELLKQADVALYQAKNGGRNRVCTYKGDLDESKG